MREDTRQSELALMVLNMRNNLPAMLELAEINGKIHRKKYLEYIHNGFTEEQALKLCTTIL